MDISARFLEALEDLYSRGAIENLRSVAKHPKAVGRSLDYLDTLAKKKGIREADFYAVLGNLDSSEVLMNIILTAALQDDGGADEGAGA